MYHVHIHVRSRKYRYNFIHIDIHIYVGIYVYVYSHIYKQIHMHTQIQLQYTQIHNDTQYINKHVYRLEIHMYIVTVPAMGRGGRGPGTVIIYIYIYIRLVWTFWFMMFASLWHPTNLVEGNAFSWRKKNRCHISRRPNRDFEQLSTTYLQNMFAPTFFSFLEAVHLETGDTGRS